MGLPIIISRTSPYPVIGMLGGIFHSSISFQDRISLNGGQKIAESSKYFRPSLSYQLSLRPLFCLVLSGRFTQVLLYIL